MSAAGTLSKLGFVPDEESGAPVYPVKAVMDQLSQAKQPSLSTVRVPSTKISSGDSEYRFSFHGPALIPLADQTRLDRLLRV